MIKYIPPISQLLSEKSLIEVHIRAKYCIGKKSTLYYHNTNLSEVGECFLLEWATEYGVNTSVIPKEQVLGLKVNRKLFWNFKRDYRINSKEMV